MCITDFSDTLSKERRTVLPSIEITSPPILLAIDLTHSRKHCCSCSDLINANTRPKVSCDGIPLGKSKNLLSHLAQVHHTTTLSPFSTDS